MDGYYDPLASLSGLIWILLFLYLIFAPQLKHQQLLAARRRLMQKIGMKRGSHVVTMIHRQESIGFFGIPIYRFIDIDDSE